MKPEDKLTPTIAAAMKSLLLGYNTAQYGESQVVFSEPSKTQT
jgi:hypothetical protein